MGDLNNKRPTCITVIGWLWIIVGGLMILSAIVVTLVKLMVEREMDTPPDLVVFHYFELFVMIQVVVAILAILGGIYFLRLRLWARTTLEVLSWLGLIYAVGFGTFSIYRWLSMSSQNGLDSPRIIGVIMGLVITAVYALPLVIIIGFLRGKTVGNAIREVTPGDKEL